MNIATLFARIGLQADTAQAEKIHSQFKGLKTTMLGLVATATAVAASIHKITADSFQASVEFKQFAAETGTSTTELQKWQAVATQTNTSTQALADGVKALALNRQKIKLGEGNISGFQLLGIDPNQDPFKILDQIKAKTEGLTPAMKRVALERLGLSSQLIQIMNLSKADFDQMKSNAFVIPEGTISTIARASASMDMSGKAIKWIFALITERLSPAIEKITKQFVRWIQENKTGIIEGFKKAFDILGRFVSFIVKTADMINHVVASTIGWKNGLYLLAGAFAFFNRALLLSPIGLISMAFLALFLILEDLYEYSKGNQDSLFGDLAKQSPGMKKMIDGIIEGFKVLGAILKAGFTGDFSDLDKMIEKWGIWRDIIEGVIQGIRHLKEGFSDIKGFFANISDFMSGKGWGNFRTDNLSEAMAQDRSDKGVLAAAKLGAGKPMKTTDELLGFVPKPLPGATNITNNVTGVSDPKEAARLTGDATKKALQSVQRDSPPRARGTPR